MSDIAHLSPPDTVAEFPLTTTQTRCWVLDRMQPGNPALNVAVRWELRGTLSAANLEAAFQAVIARHEVLRTRLVEVDGNPVQQVVARVPFKLDLVDIRAVAEAAQMARVDEIAHEVAARPFDLGRAGLIRATLVRLSAQRAMLLYVVHQSVFDGASIGVLGHEIGTIAQALEEGREPDLPELPLQYGDYALWQADYMSSGALDEDARWWEEALRGAPYFEIEPDKPRPPVRGSGCAQILRALPADFDARLKSAAQAAGMSPFSFGCGVFSACLARATGSADVLFGTQIAGRLDSALDPLIGVFINNLALRFATPGDAPLSEHLARAKAVVEGALVHQAMPFNRLVERLNPPRDAARTPLISINFNLQRVFMNSRAYGGFELVSSPSHAPGAIYDLDFAVMGRPGGWQIMAEYATELFDAATIEAMIDLLSGAFEAVFADPGARIRDLPLPAALSARHDGENRALRAAEEVLAAHPMVAEAVALRTGTGLHGFVTPGATGVTPLEDLPQILMAHAATSPDGARLSGVSVLGAFPRSSTGAVNRALLRVPAPRADRDRQAVPDATLVANLSAWWRQVLERETLPAGANFFDLGGHSVLVLRLLTLIRAGTGATLDITDIYEHPTLDGQARLLAGRRAVAEARSGDWRIMRLKRDGARLPLIAVNNAATAQALTQQAAGDRPVTCVRAFESGKGQALDYASFEAAAAEYAALIRQAQPDGPYLLYGNCVHGNLALEAARLLQAEGAEIRGVVMKDVWEPAYAQRLEEDPGLRRREALHALFNRLRMVREGDMSLAALLGSYRVARRLGLLRLMALFGQGDGVKTTDLEADQERFVLHLSALRDRYRPAPVNFPVLHVVTRISPVGRGFSPSIGWEDVCAEGCLTTLPISQITVERHRRVGIAALAEAIAQFAD